MEATLSYTISPIHNEDYFVKLAKELEKMGADAICIKDMANLLLPMDAYSLVKRLKETVVRAHPPAHPQHHRHRRHGATCMAAYAGVDIVDTALSPLANGTSQPATESLVATLKGTVRDTGLDLNKLSEAAAHFRTGGRAPAGQRASWIPRCCTWTPTPCSIRSPAACSPT